MTTPTSPTVPDRPVAVVGATGQQGGATARALLAAGADVRALVRDPDADPARDLRAAGAATVRADLTDPASLHAAFDGVAAVFAMTTFTGDGGTAAETEHGITLVDAAVAAGVPHVVYSSVGGAERHTGIPHFESKRRVEEYLEAAPIAATFVRPAFFMENLAVSDGVLRLPLPGGVPVQMVAVADIGAVAAAALLDPSRVPGGAVEIAGDERTGEQMAEALGARYEALPLSALDGDPDLRSMFAWFTELPAYRADFALTAQLAPTVHDLPAWAAGRS